MLVVINITYCMFFSMKNLFNKETYPGILSVCSPDICNFAGLSHPVFKGIMKKGYKVPTPIQRKVTSLAFVIMFCVLNIV